MGAIDTTDNINLWGKLLLIEVFIIVFIVGFLPAEWHSVIYSSMYTLLFITSAMNLDKHGSITLKIAIGVTLVEWISSSLNMPLLRGISILINVTFFTYIGAFLIVQIARAKEVSRRVILEALNGYLLLGVIFSLLIAISIQIDPASYNFSISGNYNTSDCIYYGFVTLSTLGYGDLLPLTPHAKSLALLTALGGQLYLTVIIALLVGKLSNKMKKE